MHTSARARALLEQEARDQIHAFLLQEPGIHLRGLHQRLGIPVSTLGYHLRRMQRAGLVVSRASAGLTAYYPVGIMGPREQEVLLHLRRPSIRRIIEALLEEPASTLHDLQDRLDLGAPTLSHHLRDLAARGIVRSDRWDGRNRYLLEDTESLERLIARYCSGVSNGSGVAVDTTC